MTEDMNPRGRFGFPRLSALGPFVKSGEIEPAHDTPSDFYLSDMLRQTQPQTHRDTAFIFEDIIRDEMDYNPDNKFTSAPTMDMIEWHYRDMNIGQMLSGNTFSRSLLNVMEAFEEKEGDFSFVDDIREAPFGGSMEMYTVDTVFDEVMAVEDGDSIIDESDLIGAAGTYSSYINRGDEEALYRTIDKVTTDIERVVDITEDIRSSRKYWPPTVELNGDEDSGMGWGTLDGAHRIVAMSQILGENADMKVWEFSNEEDFI